MIRPAMLVPAILVTALLLRRAVRHAVLTVWYLAIAMRRVRLEPGLRAYLTFVRWRSVRSAPAVRSPLGSPPEKNEPRTRDAHWRVRVKGSSVPPSAVPPPALLQDTRVRRLQEKAARIFLTQELGVTIAGSEAAVLGSYSSLAWLRGNLLTAAGCNTMRTIPYDELRERCRVVYPVFIRIMTMHRRVLEGGLGVSTAVYSRRWIRLRRRHRVGNHGEILDSLYPGAIPEARRRLRRYERRENTRRAYRRERTAYQLTRFERYLDAITLVAKAGVTVPARATRTLDDLYRVYQRNTTGGVIWQRGTGKRKRST